MPALLALVSILPIEKLFANCLLLQSVMSKYTSKNITRWTVR